MQDPRSFGTSDTGWEEGALPMSWKALFWLVATSSLKFLSLGSQGHLPPVFPSLNLFLLPRTPVTD